MRGPLKEEDGYQCGQRCLKEGAGCLNRTVES